MGASHAVWVLCARARGAAAAESVASAIHEAWVTAGSQFTGWGGSSVHGWLRAHVTRNSIAVAFRQLLTNWALVPRRPLTTAAVHSPAASAMATLAIGEQQHDLGALVGFGPLQELLTDLSKMQAAQGKRIEELQAELEEERAARGAAEAKLAEELALKANEKAVGALALEISKDKGSVMKGVDAFQSEVSGRLDKAETKVERQDEQLKELRKLVDTKCERTAITKCDKRIDACATAAMLDQTRGELLRRRDGAAEHGGVALGDRERRSAGVGAAAHRGRAPPPAPRRAPPRDCRAAAVEPSRGRPPAARRAADAPRRWRRRRHRGARRAAAHAAAPPRARGGGVRGRGGGFRNMILNSL